MTFSQSKKGFTLIELLVVIAIIGILSTLAIIALGLVRQKARDSKRVADLRQISNALETYNIDQGSYPTIINTGQSLAYNGTTYLAIVPSNPTPRTDGGCADLDYRYLYNSNLASYYLSGCLGGATGDAPAGGRVFSSSGARDLGDTTSLLGYWPLDETGGTSAYDLGPNNITGTSTGSTVTVGQTGKIGTSYNFATAGYINLGVKPALDISTGDFSVSLWVKGNSFVGDPYVFDRGTGSLYDGYGININSLGRVVFATDGSDASAGRVDLASSSTPALTTGTWYHIVTLRRSGVKYIYLNGVQDTATQAYAVEISDVTQQTTIGQAVIDTSRFFNGNIDDVRVYGRALTAAEITTMYNQGN